MSCIRNMLVIKKPIPIHEIRTITSERNKTNPDVNDEVCGNFEFRYLLRSSLFISKIFYHTYSMNSIFVIKN